MPIKVKLRQKKISQNRQSLYLDFYPAIINPETGKSTRREFLNLYLYDNTRNPIDKQHNKETLQIAQQIRQKRENSLNKPEVYTEQEREHLNKKQLGEKDFLAYYIALKDKRHGSNREIWAAAYSYIEMFANGNLKFSDLTPQFCDNLREYLLNSKSLRNQNLMISQNTASGYFRTFKTALKKAFKDGYIQTDISTKVAAIPPAETFRNFLSLEELKNLANTECADPLIKRAALFSALTGLRFSDISNLTWGDVHLSDTQGCSIHFRQQKTKGVEIMPISADAVVLMGERKETHKQVFEGLKKSAYGNVYMYRWLGAAGITKHITFHCFRHTFATIQLSLGTDIYTVSKMLGHRELSTTQVYAKVIDKSKREAADRIKLDL
ncbi:MAG: site-specific integrase [Bacteroidetes bacterium]|nr:site-specific integrase [Bacteroidota bacterium]